VTTLLSKEIWVVDHGFAEVIGFFGATWFLTVKVGPAMAKWLDAKNDVSFLLFVCVCLIFFVNPVLILDSFRLHLVCNCSNS
jgi:hypothetical protein